MIEILIFAVPAGIVAVTSAFVDRRIQARRDAKMLGNGNIVGSIQGASANINAQTGSDVTNRYNPIPMARRSKKSARFLDWANSTFSEGEPVRLWLNALPERELKSLLKKLNAHCSKQGFELDWLTGYHLNRNSQLVQVAAKTVWHFCGASQQASDAQESIAAFNALQELRRRPMSRANQKLSEMLMLSLIERGLADVQLHTYLGASNRQKKKYILDAVREAEIADPDTFYQIWDALANGTAMPSPASTKIENEPDSIPDSSSGQTMGGIAAMPA